MQWSTSYDRGTRVKPGQLSQGSGTTPTLIDDDLVAITDNADPRMNVIFLDRNDRTRSCVRCRSSAPTPATPKTVWLQLVAR
ncbi:MAG: hypothetical protein V9G13_11560 [Marmoricola sp.]